MTLQEVRPGLKRWATVHPDFNPVEGQLDDSYTPVASTLYHAPNALVLIDPLVPDELWPALDAEVKESGAPVVVLTTSRFTNGAGTTSRDATARSSAASPRECARSRRSAATKS